MNIKDRLSQLLSRKDHISRLRSFSAGRWPKELGNTHGVKHWDRVARFGQMLLTEDADRDMIMAFAYLHDSERKANGEDIEHGKRASALIDAIRQSQLYFLTDSQITKLKRACELHTIEHQTGDITIDICFDADRMDLLRVGIMPLPDKMATVRGAELVSNPEFMDFYAEFNLDSTIPI